MKPILASFIDFTDIYFHDFILDCDSREREMVMCHGRSYTLHEKTKNGENAKQYDWYKMNKGNSPVRLESDSEYSITYSSHDTTKSSLAIRSFSMAKHEGFYAFREANLKHIDCYDYKVKALRKLNFCLPTLDQPVQFSKQLPLIRISLLSY